MVNRHYQRCAGFSLLEVLIAASVALMLSSAVIAAMIASQRSFLTGNAQLEMHSAARITLEWLTYDIRWAQQVDTSCSIGGTTYSTANDTLVLRIPAIDASNNIIDGTFDAVVYRLTTAAPVQLERIVGPAAGSSRQADNHVLAKNVVSFNLTSAGTGLGLVADLSSVENIAVTLSMQKPVLNGGVVDYTARTAVQLRNRNL